MGAVRNQRVFNDLVELFDSVDSTLQKLRSEALFGDLQLEFVSLELGSFLGHDS